MVLNGEEDKALRVLLEEGLIGFCLLDGGSNDGLWCILGLLDFLDDSRLVVGVDLLGEAGDRVGVVLLVSDAKVELLNW